MALARLDKIIASGGRWSRREIKQMVKSGRILLDGKPVSAVDVKCDPETARIQVDGEVLFYSACHYVMLHKPAGILSATEDRRAETVLDLLPPELQKLELFPVGRLDKDTEGLLLMTDDGALAHRLLSPKHHVDKVYYVRTEGCLNAEDCAAFAAGLLLGDGLQCMSAGLEILRAGEESEALVTLREGKFHQIKRMLASRGKPVLYLKRLSMGPLQLDDTLEKGKWRYLTNEEKEALLLLKS